ncbi:hypothetical protein RFI_13614 [Reticulomyxa filosa]|uniref:Uncharacterized protein n=1 Tax=Reticulomyxa filosa TaxID=46433 RepID=X6NC18_RETFI|nr:hypothetical protein RFI_13614 [Reticulomyxa filosa]|eukprot:ETO23566.1 hypothetical protein RFI_13614 [Reticulomyxa filosa]
MSLFKAYVWNGSKIYTIILEELTIENLKYQSNPLQNAKQIESPSKEDVEEKNERIEVNEVRNPLVLLAGEIEQKGCLGGARQDFNLLQTLFETNLGMKFISRHCHTNGYDGLIFVWCGYERFKSNGVPDNTYFKDIKNLFVSQTQYFVGKPKVLMNISYSRQRPDNRKISDTWLYNVHSDIFSICVNIPISSIEEHPVSLFIKVFCQVLPAYINKSFHCILQQLSRILLHQLFDIEEGAETDLKTCCDFYLIPRSSAENVKSNLLFDTDKDKNIPETLSFKNHWNKDWKKANLEAAKVVEQMFERVEQGMIVVAKTISERQSNNNNDNTSSFFMQIHDHKVEKKQFGEYWVHVIKGKTIILDNVNIDGNMYVVNCEIQCKTNVHITTQVFVTNNGLVDQHCVNPIQWNTKFHHDIPLLLQNLQDQSNNCSKNQLFDGAIVYLEKSLEISIDTFGLNHHSVAGLYNNLGNAYQNKQQYNRAVTCYENALHIYLDIFGTVHAHIANSFYNLGNACINKGEYNKAIESYQKALKLYLEIFGRNHY